MADKYQLMQGPNGEALVYSTDTQTVMPLPGTDAAAGGPGAPMRFQEAQAKWQDLLPQIPQLLQSATSTNMQPGVVPAGYNPAPPPAAMPPSGPPKQSADGRYQEVDTPDGRMIQDTQSGVRYSANMAPQNVLDSLYGPAAPASQRPSDAATPVGQTAAPIVNGVVKTNVVGNPTAGERANGITTTQYPLPATPGAGIPAPVGAGIPAPVGASGGDSAASRPGFTIPRMNMPTNVDYTSPSAIFASYAGVNRPAPAPAPAPQQSQGTQFRPLSAGPLPPTAATAPQPPLPPRAPVPYAPDMPWNPPAPPTNPQNPDAAYNPVMVPLSARPAPTVNVGGQQAATLQPSAITGSAAYNQQQTANQAALQASNAQGAAQANTRVWGYGDAGEEGGGGYGYYLPSQLTTPPGTAAPNMRPDLLGQPAPQQTAGAPGASGGGGGFQTMSMSPAGGGAAVPVGAGGGGFRPLSAIGGAPVPGAGGGGAPQPPATPPPTTPPAAPPPPTAPPATGGGVPSGFTTVPTQTRTQARDPYTGAPLFDPKTGAPLMTETQSQTYQPTPGYLNPAQVDQLVASTGLTAAQTKQVLDLLQGQIDIQHATVDQIYSSIKIAAGTLGLQIDQQKFNQGYLNTQQQIQQNQFQQTFSGFDNNGNPGLAALKQQEQNAIDYANSSRQDLLAQNTVAGTMGYDANNNPTLVGQQTLSSEERANLIAQANIGDQAARIQLQDLLQKEGQRQFDATNALARQEADRQWRQNPASFLDQAWANRGVAAPTGQSAGGFAAPNAAPATAASGTQYSTMSAPVGSAAATQGQAGYTPATQQGPLTYNDIQRSGVEPPGVAAATGGFQQMPQYQTAGGMPRISQQAYGQLNPTEQQAFGAELQATGNNPDDYFKQQQMLTQNPIRSGGGFSAPRPQVAGSL